MKEIVGRPQSRKSRAEDGDVSLNPAFQCRTGREVIGTGFEPEAQFVVVRRSTFRVQSTDQ
jgi:hypothetical protein